MRRPSLENRDGAGVAAAELAALASAGFEAVDLDTLARTAELQTRVDRKYILPAPELAAVVAALPAPTRVLEVDGERALRYASRYFDTPALDSFRGAAYGRRRRFKVRARTYVDSGGTFLEVKTRGGRAATVKDRIPVAGDTLTADAAAAAAELLADAGIPGAARVAASLGPVLDTAYRRVTLLLPDNTRGTIDADLRWRRVPTGERLALPGTLIVETKSAGRPGPLDAALWRAGHRPSSLSKYATGLAALDPALPRNKWLRVLRRHFAERPLAERPLAERTGR